MNTRLAVSAVHLVHLVTHGIIVYSLSAYLHILPFTCLSDFWGIVTQYLIWNWDLDWACQLDLRKLSEIQNRYFPYSGRGKSLWFLGRLHRESSVVFSFVLCYISYINTV